MAGEISISTSVHCFRTVFIRFARNFPPLVYKSRQYLSLAAPIADMIANFTFSSWNHRSSGVSFGFGKGKWS